MDGQLDQVRYSEPYSVSSAFRSAVRELRHSRCFGNCVDPIGRRVSDLTGISTVHETSMVLGAPALGASWSRLRVWKPAWLVSKSDRRWSEGYGATFGRVRVRDLLYRSFACDIRSRSCLSNNEQTMHAHSCYRGEISSSWSACCICECDPSDLPERVPNNSSSDNSDAFQVGARLARVES
jgi:hypothetical protein